MTDLNLFDAYRKMFGTAGDGETCWWYLGTTFVQIPGYAEIPVISPETIMVYRTETVADDEFKLHWLEVGCFRDLLTGELVESWINPITGKRISAPNSFAEGPACYTIKASGNGLDIGLTQAHAKIISVEPQFRVNGDRVHLTQTETKVRGFPNSDGTLPEPGSPGSARAVTTLAIYADRADIEDSAVQSTEATGTYSLDLIDMIPAWMGFGDTAGKTRVCGVMHKTAMNDPINKSSWDRLNGLFPKFFKAGRVDADWR